MLQMSNEFDRRYPVYKEYSSSSCRQSAGDGLTIQNSSSQSSSGNCNEKSNKRKNDETNEQINELTNEIVTYYNRPSPHIKYVHVSALTSEILLSYVMIHVYQLNFLPISDYLLKKQSLIPACNRLLV